MKRRKRSAAKAGSNRWAKRLRRRLVFGWLSLCVAALFLWWLGWGFVDGSGHRVEHGQLLETIMAIIAFPTGLIWIWLSPLVEPLAATMFSYAGFPASVWLRYGPELFSWFGATLIGYVQWFWLIPKLFSLRLTS